MEPFLTGWNFGLIWNKNRRNKRKASLLTKIPPNGMHSPLVLIFTVFFFYFLSLRPIKLRPHKSFTGYKVHKKMRAFCWL